MKATPTSVRWEGASPAASYANVFEISADRSEVTLSFGTRRGRVPDSDEVVLEVSDRVVLGPSTAKRLAQMLAHAVRDYEWERGSLGGEPLPPPAPLSPRKSPEVLTGGIPPQAAELLRLLESLGVQPVLERSFKMFERTMLANRFLWGFKRDSLTEQAGERLLEICAGLGMPEHFRRTFRTSISRANILFVGFEENERSHRYKAYLEFGDRLIMARAQQRREPLLLYVGFKWDARDGGRHSVARYTCYPGFSAAEMVQRIAQAFAGQASGAPLEIARAIVEQAAGRVGADRFLYLETTEDDNPRSSFDINLYNARLRLRDLHPLFLKICEHYAIPAEQFEAAYAPVSAAPFGHVTGGVDREGKDFLSIYFGAQ